MFPVLVRVPRTPGRTTLAVGVAMAPASPAPASKPPNGRIPKRFVALGWCGPPPAVTRPHDLATRDEPSPSPALTTTIPARQHGTPSVRCRSAGGTPLAPRPARRVP